MRKKLVLGIIGIMTLAIAGCGKTKAETNNTEVTYATVDEKTSMLASESFTKTMVVVVKVEDENGNEISIGGVATIDENNDVKIAVEGESGKEILVKAKAEKTGNNEYTFKSASFETSGTIVKKDGSSMTIDQDTYIIEVVENNNGDVEIDVTVSEDKLREVEEAQQHETAVAQAKEEVAKVEETNAAIQISKNEENANTQTSTTQAQKPVENKPTEAPETQQPETEAPETQAPTTEAPETQAPTTEAPETQAPTQKPTEAETQAPTQKPTEAETEAPTKKVNNCPYTLYQWTYYRGKFGYFGKNGDEGTQRLIDMDNAITNEWQYMPEGFNVGDFDDMINVWFTYCDSVSEEHAREYLRNKGYAD